MKKTIIHGCEARGDSNSPYLTRYTILETRWFQLCVHVFHRSDADEMHDHPWNFITVPLWRGYWDVTPEGRRRAWPLVPYYRTAEHCHRVQLLRGFRPHLSNQQYEPGKYAMGYRYQELPALSLVVMFKRRREWGFFTKSGWLNWRKYFEYNRC